MRHYDRAGYRHLDDAQRYRDHEYLADDRWVGPNEHDLWEAWGPSGAGQGRAAEPAPPSRPFPAYGLRPTPPSYEGRGPRRRRVPPVTWPRHRRLVDVLLHPRQRLRHAFGGLLAGRDARERRAADRRIHDEVCEHLTHHRDVDATDIEVSVEDREVTLRGTVATRPMKYMAEDAVAAVAGVAEVHNRLRVPLRPLGRGA